MPLSEKYHAKIYIISCVSAQFSNFPTGQVRFLLDKLVWTFSVDASLTRPIRTSYSLSTSSLKAVNSRRSQLEVLIARQRSEARIMAPNISFKTAFLPQAFGMIFKRRRSSTNSLLSRLVICVARRWVIGVRRCELNPVFRLLKVRIFS